MSYCILYEIKNNELLETHEFENSHLGASIIWTTLFDAYLKNYNVPNDTWLFRFLKDPNWKGLWNLYNDSRLSFFERIVHLSTMDYAIIRKENFIEYAQNLRNFVKKYGSNNHLSAWADIVEKSKADLICFYQTSTGNNLWCEFDEETENYKFYDFSVENKHFNVFKELKK